jgi:hypothetical protein
MTDSADHVTGKTGLTLTITASKAGAAFASIAPTVTERGDGWYALALTSSHTDTLGDLGLHITSTGADPADLLLNVTANILGDVATAVNLATVAGYLDTEIAAILADTNELQTDWADGGRLDAILDARASQTSVDDLPTNAELTTALAAADDAVLAAIAALSVPTANQNADALLDRASAIETGWTVRQGLRVMLAAMAGKASGLPTAPVYRDVLDTKARITATTDTDGNRTAVTLDGD